MGIEFKRCGYDYILTQARYTTSMLKHFGFENAKSTPTPMSTSPTKSQKHTTLMRFNLNEIVGSLLWLSKTTRPDIAYCTAYLAQQVNNPTSASYSIASRIFRYLRGTTELGLRMHACSQSSLEVYADADWASDSSRKSQSGVLIYFGKSLVAWSSKKQATVSLSTTEAEIIALGEAITLTKWFLSLLHELHLPLQLPIPVYEDNAGAIFLANTTIQSKRLKHIDIKWHFINDEIKTGTVKLFKIPTELNVADLLTKPLPIPKFRQFLSRVISISSDPAASTYHPSSSSFKAVTTFATTP